MVVSRSFPRVDLHLDILYAKETEHKTTPIKTTGEGISFLSDCLYSPGTFMKITIFSELLQGSSVPIHIPCIVSRSWRKAGLFYTAVEFCGLNQDGIREELENLRNIFYNLSSAANESMLKKRTFPKPRIKQSLIQSSLHKDKKAKFQKTG